MLNFGETSNVGWLILLLVCGTFLSGFFVTADASFQYDYFATLECLSTPNKPQYNGGIIRNPELNRGLTGWSKFGNPKMDHHLFQGNGFVVIHSRNQPSDSVSQKIYMQKNKLYTFSAWIQVSEGEIPVRAVFKTSSGYKHAGAVVAQSKCWSMLKGGLTVDASGLVELYFEAKNTSVEIWVDSISLQPFTKKEWKSHQDKTIEMTRKNKIKIRVLNKQNQPLANDNVSIEAVNGLRFPVGCAINKNILNNTAYQNWFTSRFTVATFEDEMKWWSNENIPGKEDNQISDAMLKFAQQHRINVRGHTVLWDDPKYQPWWVYKLSPKQLLEAALKRIKSIMKRYKGKVIGWDVVNEIMHFSFFESKLGDDASGSFYRVANEVDGGSTLFLNDYNTIENPSDPAVTPSNFIKKINEIQSFGGVQKNLGIGLESHFNTPNIPYMRSAIDTMAATGLPIWMTEVDVGSGPNQAMYLEQVLREGHAHPSVKGIVIWAAWKPSGCYRMCLTDNNFKNLPTGDVVDKLLKEWGSGPLSTVTDSEGFFAASLYHGKYQVKVASTEGAEKRLLLKL